MFSYFGPACCLLLYLLLLPTLVQAQQQQTTLENPGNGKHYSGIGVISGWQCALGRLTVRFNGGSLIPLAHGSERPDTRQVCGHPTTGFVTIYNWARLGDGQHTAVLYSDGVEVARSTFTVGTAGTEFVRGVQTSVTVQNFPEQGKQQQFEWNQNTQHMEMVHPARPSVTGTGGQSANATLENPGHGLNYSGIGVISGWKCSAVRLTARVDGGDPIPLLYGNERPDVQSECGHTTTGFIAIQNWGELGPGMHTIVVYDAEKEFARSTFTVGTPGTAFVRGASARVTVPDIPYAGQTMDFEWNQNSQHLEMVGSGTGGSGSDTPSFGSAIIANQRFTQNTAITSLTLPQATGGTAPLVYNLSPALPAGLSFNQTTRTLSGTPTSSLATTTYTYTVIDGTGATASLTFSLTVTTAAASTTCTIGFSACNSNPYHTVVEAAPWLTNETSCQGGIWWAARSSQSAADQLANTFCEEYGCTTCTVTRRWTGSACLARADRVGGDIYYGWAADPTQSVAEGKALEACQQSGGDSTPSFGGATIANQRFTRNAAITSLTLPQATGGTAPLVYNLSPALPAGLSFNQTTRTLSGTPTSTLAATTYTYTVTDGTGATASLTFSLTVGATQSPSTITNSLGMEMVLIPAGTFQMGSPASETGRRSNEGPVHQVTIGQGFYLGKYEVTQAQWRAVVRTNPVPDICDTCPIGLVTQWQNVQHFIKKLNEQEGVTTYRLPTEAEWEYAARAGTTTAYSFGDAVDRLGLYAWYDDNAGGKAQPVGGKRPNGFGLYDMHGNAFEMVQDRWNDSYTGAPTDGSAWLTGQRNVVVLRGGSIASPPWTHRSAFRFFISTDFRFLDIGFRLARSLD